jgi:uncharacterized protein with HEPN domain
MSENQKNNRDFIFFLEDLLLSISRIEEYIKGFDLIDFRHDYKTVDAVIRNFEIIGEAAKNVPVWIKDKYPSVPWEEMYYLRNKISHEYFGIDYEIIWDIIINHLPKNKSDLEQIIKAEKK